MDHRIHDVLDRLEFGPGLHPPGFVVLPILAPSQAAPAYLTLGTAIASGDFAVSEVSERGAVSRLLVVNGGALPVLLLDGQELLGAKQNRIINVTTLVPAHAELELPVSCTERGRWRHVSRTFTESDVVAAPSVRRTMNTSVMARLRSVGEYSSDQLGVWQSVAGVLERGGTLSATDAMSEAFEAHRESVASAGESVPLSDGQVGMVVLRGGQVVGFEYVGRHEAYAAAHSKLVASYAMEYSVLGAAEELAPAAEEDAVAATRAFVTTLQAAPATEQPAVGMGTYHALSGDHVTGSALVCEGALVHLTAFSN